MFSGTTQPAFILGFQFVKLLSVIICYFLSFGCDDSHRRFGRKSTPDQAEDESKSIQTGRQDSLPHGGMERPLPSDATSPVRSHSRKQSPDNISLKSSDSNVSSTSDISAVTQASMSSAFSTQSERPRHTRKLR